MTPKMSLIPIAVLYALTLAACGDGDKPGNNAGGSGGTTGGGPAGGTSGGGVGGGSYLFYRGSLMAVDPDEPATPVTVESGDDIIDGSERTVYFGNYTPATQIVSNMHVRGLIYAKSDGRLYRISALTSASPTPSQLSSENAANTLCTQLKYDNDAVDLNDVNMAQYLYPLPGGDGLCGTSDDEWKMVRFGMGPGDAPVAAKPPVMPLGDAASGALSGWLVNDNGAIRRCDANFANCGPTLKTVAGSAHHLLDTGLNRALLDIDGQLFVYDDNGSALSAPLFTIPPSTFLGGPPVTDGNAVFFEHDKTIYRLPADGSAPATALAVDTAPVFRVLVTSTNVVYQTDTELKAVDKTKGGTASGLLSLSGGNNAYVFQAGDDLYYTVQKLVFTPSFSVEQIKAGIVDHNGNAKLEVSQAAWVGGSARSNFNMGTGSALAADKFDSLILAQGKTNRLPGATLKSFDTASASEIAELGTVPDDVDSVNCFGIANDALCSALVLVTPPPVPPAPPFQVDILFVNPMQADSLTRLTNTPDKIEAPLWY